jgi:Rod binding domain-containing protein
MDIGGIQYRPYLPNRELPNLSRPQASIPSKVPPAGGRTRVDRSSELYKVSQEFEAIFIKQMLNVMRKSVNKTGLMDGGMAEEIFEDMLYDEYAQKMAESGSFGIADMIYRQLNPNE